MMFLPNVSQQSVSLGMNLVKIFLLALIITPAAGCKILEVYPNPYGDEGAEYVKVWCDSCIFTDGEDNFTVTGTAYVARNSTAFKEKFGFYSDFEGIKLSNSGEDIYLICNNTTDKFNWKFYRDEGVIYFRTEKGWDFRYEDWSRFDPVKDYVEGSIIITPAEYVLEGEGIVASYFVTEDNFKGNFEFIVDANPVGGIPLEEYELSKKYKFHFLSSNSYKNFHYKFAVIGDHVMITTENWKWDNRGVIVDFESGKVADLLRKVFYNDLKYEGEMGKVDGPKESGKGKGKRLDFKAEIEVHIMPDSNPVFDFIENSRDYLYIAAPYINFEWFDGVPLLNAIENASKRGVKIRVMLNDYDRNREIAEILNAIPNVEAKILKSSEFDELHAKYLLTDGKVLITSANLNKYGLKLNREIAVVIQDQKVEEFMKNVFLEDWENKRETNAVFSLISLGFVVLIALYLIRRINK